MHASFLHCCTASTQPAVHGALIGQIADVSSAVMNALTAMGDPVGRQQHNQGTLAGQQVASSYAPGYLLLQLTMESTLRSHCSMVATPAVPLSLSPGTSNSGCAACCLPT